MGAFRSSSILAGMVGPAIAGMALAFSGAAQAGFIDESAPPPPPPAIANHPLAEQTAPSVENVAVPAPADEVFSGANEKGWNLPAPPVGTASGTMGLMRAIVTLLPPGMDGVRLALLAVDPELQVSWSHSDSRMDAFKSILRANKLRAVLKDNRLTVSPDIESTESTGKLAQKNPAQKAPAVDLHAQPIWILEKGKPISASLMDWAKLAHWTLIWNAPQDWLVPNTMQIKGDFTTAVTQVINDLAANGADVRGDSHLANKVFVVHAAGQGD